MVLACNMPTHFIFIKRGEIMIKLFDSNMNEVTIKREMYQWDIFPLLGLL